MKYNKNPVINCNSCKIVNDKDLVKELSQYQVISVELYPGLKREEIINDIKLAFSEYNIIEIEKNSLNFDFFNQVLNEIGNDRIFAKMQSYEINQFYKKEALLELESKIKQSSDKFVIVGMGTNLLNLADAIKIHIGATRWSIQTNYRDGYSNWMQSNNSDEHTKKFKYGYFFEWRIADKIKHQNIDSYTYLIDCTEDRYIGLSSTDYKRGLRKAVNQPFRLTPFFDPGVWGGKWMKKKFDLDVSKPNYAWSFDGVLEENSIALVVNDQIFNYPGIDLVLEYPQQLLGVDVFERYGAEFPIRFDLLDTIGGQNLSLQVHPSSQYIKDKFLMDYTQEESYYILDTQGDESYVYIGLKNGVTKDKFFSELRKSYKYNLSFDVEKYVNKIKCRKGDHFLIPAGTIHCSGKDVMVLEISQTPYIFTFKLWDWERVDLNGKPRPINLEHGEAVLNENFNTEYIYNNLFNHFEKVNEDTIKSGLHHTQDIVSLIITTTNSKRYMTKNRFHMINVVEGPGVKLVSPSNKFDDFIITEYETTIVPAAITEYEIVPLNRKEVKYVQVYNK